MSTSPYKTPNVASSPVAGTPLAVRWLCGALGLVIAVPGVISLLIVAAAEVAGTTDLAILEIEVASPIEIASSALAAIAGLSLVLRSRYSPYLLGTLSVVLAGVVVMGSEFGPRQFVWLAIYIAAFLLSIWVTRKENRGKRPNNSSKPTPLRGAA